MSDQPSPPPKPKPGSLRDRIAAFEKSSATPAPGPAPAPRPKPAGFSSWKPKPPSRPSTPPAVSTDQSPAAAASMSASDAKESITKGGSLKDRMAALQGKGAFGAPAPPVAAKPTVERPKWKPPPPVSAPADNDDHAAKEGSGGDFTAAFERSISPPVAPKPAELAGSSHSRKNSVEVSSPQPLSGEHDDATATGDPEEEERQRRAALAARMARLGGARMGMAPPILGKKPPARKPTQEEQPAVGASKPTETEEHPQAVTSPEPLVSDNQSVSNQSPSVTPSMITSASPEERRTSTDYITSRKDSEDTSILSSQSTDSQATKSPSSMPIPAVPRRTGPPRKKPVKPSAPPPEVPEEKLTDEIPALDTTSEKIGDTTQTPVHQESFHETPEDLESITTHAVKVPQDQDHAATKQDTGVPSGITEAVEKASTGQDIQHLIEVPEHVTPPPETLTTHPDSSDLSPVVPTAGILPPPPSHVTEDNSRDEVTAEGGPALSSVTLLPSPSEAIPPLDVIAAGEDSEVGTPVAEIHNDELYEAAEEETRKKRVAERLAKMGGINPFAPQLPKDTFPPQPTHEAHLPEESQPLTTTTPVRVESKKHKEETSVEEAQDDVESDGSVYEPEPEATLAEEYFSAIPMSNSHELPVPQSPPPLPGNRPSKRSSVVRQSSNNPYSINEVTRSHPSRQASLASEPEEAPSPPSRQIQPPRRIVPQTPSDDAGDHDEEHSDDEDKGSLTQSQRFVPPPQHEYVEAHPRRRFIQDDDDVEGNGSENDSPALPVPHRRSVEVPPVRSIPPPPPADEYSETESDHDGQALPILPRRVAPPPTIVSSPPPEHQALDVETPSIHDHLTPTSLSAGREILDEEEGDPIDPNFHSPSRRTSFADISSAAQTQTPPAPQSPPVRSPPAAPGQLPIRKSTDQSLSTSSKEKGESQVIEDPELVRRNTLADRMAKLGGIKFGAAPPVPGQRPPHASPPPADDPQEDAPREGDLATELTEEDEERARKERIAAKLANMGGMRIGMMPMGMGGLPPQRSHILKEDPVSPPPPSRQTRLPPPAPDLESESASVATSDDGVKVEAEESEADEASYQAEPVDAPSVPSRVGRQSHRRESTEVPSSPPPGRPPVPAAHRRSSVQSTTERSVPHRKESSQPQQTDYVMVEEGENEEAPPLPPGRHAPRSPPPQPAVPGMTASQDMSSWEIPEFDTHTDLSLSWTDAGETTPPSASTSQTAPPPPPPQSAKSLPIDRTLTADDLIALWGRVGVQVCEVATTLFDKSKKTLVGDGTYNGFIRAVLTDVPNAAGEGVNTGQYGYLIYAQNGSNVQKRASDIMPGDLVELQDAKLKGHKGLQAYQQAVGGPNESVVGIIGEFEAKKSKIRVFQANQHVGQQTVESVSYRLEDLKSGTVKIYRILEA
ncbi:hypothetical protein CPB83DRAFT_846035 [Crepidotus variabilis]|uniref:BBC1/AIM3 cysteine proteinase-fold domain-containing protein n=1 Tax=Crepidotus variabilis TaxID=179855 RepID=A0A9P6EQQ4_9AGAR|nr:hypothetical protein CPB83DRAFT_846035 [Crepidotus variabilis]